MKYMLLIYENLGTRDLFFSPEGKELMAQVNAIVQELTESGELLGGEGLADPSNARSVRLRDGVPVVTDGPFAEAKEHLGGYVLVECESIERATDIARRWPTTEGGGMEVRPLMSPSGTEM